MVKGETPSAGWLYVAQVRSSIGTKPKHRGTLRALGLRGVGQSNIVPDRPEIRGMLARVPFLVEVQEADAPLEPRVHRSVARLEARKVSAETGERS